jgi:hypothetical protein
MPFYDAAGYWAHLLQQRGVDITPYDKHAASIPNKWCEVLKGTAKVLESGDLASHNLLLCYPDETSNVGARCLISFQGEFLLHIGELITTGSYTGGHQAPFGRTSSSDFQVALCEAFHCVLVVPLVSFPFARDCLSVWKRTQCVAGRSGAASDEWKDVPPEERLPLQIVAPAYKHLLQAR